MTWKLEPTLAFAAASSQPSSVPAEAGSRETPPGSGWMEPGLLTQFWLAGRLGAFPGTAARVWQADLSVSKERKPFGPWAPV